MDAVRVVGTPASRHAPSKGSISAGSASSARITSSARPSRSAFFTCLMPTTFLDWRCSSTVGHPHVFARQDSRGHTHARMNYSRINEIRQLYLCPEKRKFSIFSAIARLSPASAQSPKRHRAPLSISRGFPQKKPRRVLRPQAQNKIENRVIRRPRRPETSLSACKCGIFALGAKIIRAVRLHSLSTKNRAPRALYFSLMSYILSSSIISSVTTDSGVTPGSKSR